MTLQFVTPVPSAKKSVASKGLSLKRNFSWSLVGNVVYAGCQWGILVVLTRLTTPEMVGRFALGLAVTAPVIMLSNLNLRSVQATDAREEYQFGHYLGLRLLTTVSALMIILAVSHWGNYGLETSLVILAVGCSKAFESISDVYFGFMQRHEQMDIIAKSQIIKGVLSLCVLGGLVFFSKDIIWGVMGLALTWAVVLIGYDLPCAVIINKKKNQYHQASATYSGGLLPVFDWERLRCLAWLALPLGIMMGLGSLNSNLPRYFIEHYCGQKELGIFSSLAYIIVAGRTVVTALAQAAAPRLAVFYASGELVKFRKLILSLTGMSASLGIISVGAAFLSGRRLLALLYGSEYSCHENLFVLLMIAGTLSYVSSILDYGMTAARFIRVQAPLFILVVGFTAIFSYMLIPSYGIWGAAIAITIGTLTQVFGRAMIITYALIPQKIGIDA